MKLIQKIKSTFFTKEFIKFVLVGGINTLNGLWIPAVLSLILQENIAYVISYIPSLAISYILNSLFTFKDKDLKFIKYIKFCISYLPNFIIQNLVFILVFNVLHWNKYIGIVMASAIGIPITFLLMKIVVFNKNNKGEEKNG